ncbi:MAG: nitrous oxide reductase accessory protein NosL [Thermus sp.]|uniref:nitrous oxide reductase accessory protein NosL n=1 Tax=Thermus sp. TaxID=275 RepID=UPI0025DB77E4|nr:nitrous oxide reductase accessory protein NosL [Thermus sp.]MCS6868112.1 nitrous oxide reductase accessory protein NosL [Thermus sp.]MDW8016944.1 nitrous oxide reductase accessory protein NosL [Thermus sp.]
MERRRFLWVLAGSLLPWARGAPRALRVGVEACPYCFMTLLDARHAAQAVNPQGKAFFYDDPACLLDQLNGWGGPSLRAREVYLADYGESTRSEPRWVPAEGAILYHHPRIRTPMGSGLLAFARREALESHLRERPERAGGRVLSWAQALKEGGKRPWVPAAFFPPPPKAP